VDAIVCGTLLRGAMVCLSSIFSGFLVGAKIFMVGALQPLAPSCLCTVFEAFTQNFFLRISNCV